MTIQAKSPFCFSLLVFSQLWVWSSSSTSFSWPLESLFERIESSIDHETVEISIHPFIDQNNLSLFGAEDIILNRAERGEISLHDALKTIISSHIPQETPDIKVKTNAVSEAFYLHGKNTKRIVSGNLEIHGIPFCRYEVKLHRDKNGSISMIGRLPKIPPGVTYANLGEWPHLEDAWTLAKSKIVETTFLDHQEPELISYKKCYELLDDQIISTWELVGRSGNRSYTVLADSNQAYEINPLYFEVDGNVQAYRLNPKDGELVTYTTKLKGDGYLRSSFFETSTDSNRATAKAEAYSADHNFVYDPNDPEFPEASVFIHATNMLAYFQELGFRFTEKSPILLEVHAVLGNNRNNALYQPAGAVLANQAIISIGDGDGAVLRNLALDSDVVSHEFGHHVVFNTLKTTSGESLVLHEGLADFFAFSRTADPCLGESICPEGSSSCMIEATCLRSADLDLSYGDSQYRILGSHLKGQVVSGMLWNLRESMGLESITEVTFSALEYFVRDTGYQDFLVSLLLADQELNQGANTCSIVDAANAKGLSQFLRGVDCNNASTWPEPGTEIELSEGSSSPGSTSSDNGFFNCGTVGGFTDSPSNNNYLLHLFLFLSPLLALLILRNSAKQ